MQKRILPLLPQLFTFSTLVVGIISIILSVENYPIWAGVLILVGLVTDSLDGIIARATKTSSDFGLQLDSLADTVCFGVAAMLFAYQNLRLNELGPLASLLIVLPVPIAGIFRLARFNLLPAKTGKEGYTTGLAITSAGSVMALAGLSDLHYHSNLLPLPVIALLPLLLAVLMVSQIPFPSLKAVFRRKKTAAVILSVGTLLSIPFSPQLVFFTIYMGYVGFGLARAGYGRATR